MRENAEPTESESVHDCLGRARPTDPVLARPTEAAGNGGETHFGLNAEGEFHYLPHRLAQRLHVPENVQVVDPRFIRYRYSYLAQSGLAVVAMLIILVFVDSLSDAALAAGLGSSLVIVFVHPSSNAARPRSLIGGHGFGLVVGTCALLLFLSPVGDFLEQTRVLFDLTLAVSVGALILVMAITDTEHPPAAGTVLGVAMQPWDPVRVAVIIAAVILLALIKWLFHNYLRDLI